LVTTDEFQLIRYQRSDRERVFAFLREVFSAADGERLIRQWEWKYDANPFNCDGQPNIELLQTSGRLVGMYGRIFFPAVEDGRELLAHQGCDLVIHPAYRGRDLSARLRGRRDRIDSPIHFSWQNEASRGAARREGKAGVPFTSLFKPLDYERLMRRTMSGRWLGGVAAFAGRALQHLPSLRGGSAAVGVTVTPLDSFDERFDRLWQHVCRDFPVMIVRNRRYLEWRFAQRPDAKYDIIAATKDSELVGYMITRCVDRAGDPWGYLVDFVVRDKSRSSFDALLEHAIESLRRKGALALSCRIAVAPYRRMLYRRGFVPSLWSEKGYIRATRRLPDRSQGADNLDRWFLTMGDGDLEMSL
jgi:GNAT superfamily N-acetyltransferase